MDEIRWVKLTFGSPNLPVNNRLDPFRTQKELLGKHLTGIHHRHLPAQPSETSPDPGVPQGEFEHPCHAHVVEGFDDFVHVAPQEIKRNFGNVQDMTSRRWN